MSETDDYTLVIELRARRDVDLDRLGVFVGFDCCWSTAVCFCMSSLSTDADADNSLIVGVVIVFVFDATCVE